jgi:hypothetical protein
MIVVPIIATTIVVLGLLFGACAWVANELSEGNPGSVRWWRDVFRYMRNALAVIVAVLAFMALIFGLVALWYWGTGYNMDYFWTGTPSTLG